MSHVHTLGGSGCMPRSSPLPINSREGWSRGQSGWRVNLDPPPWMFRWCHKSDLWPRSLAATRPTLNLNFRVPSASMHAGHMLALIHLQYIYMHTNAQCNSLWKRAVCCMSPKMLSTLCPLSLRETITLTDCVASLSFIHLLFVCR